MFAAVLLGVGVSALLFYSIGPPRDARTPDGIPPALETPSAPGSSPAKRADAEGSKPRSQIRFLELDSNGEGSSTASGDGFADSTEPVRTPSDPAPLRKGSGEVVFAVENAAGHPLRDVSVSLQQLDPGGGTGHAMSGGRGEARFFDLAPGPYSYRAHARGRSELASTASFRLEDGERKSITVRLGEAGLSIVGRIRNQRGEPVVGIAVSAVRHRFASSVSEDESGDGSTRSTRSREDGSFEIGGLAEGEYEVRTLATDRYAPLTVTLQAGAGATDLILVEGFAIDGTVTDEAGEPLARVWVGLREDRNRFTYTDDAGRYRLQLGSGVRHLNSTVRFYLAGYEERLLGFPGGEAGNEFELRLDTALRPAEDAVSVVGSVRTERGGPIAGATVVFGSPELRTHYQTISDPDGNFEISNVVIGSGYQLRVLPNGSYFDYSRDQILVSEDGNSFEVVLEALSMGRLTGRMVDLEGDPIPDFRIWLLSTGASRNALPISSDEQGYFELADAPAGSLTFDTRASPRHIVRGVYLPADGEREVSLVLDWGALEMTGEVLDDRGDPVGGAEVKLSWSDTNGEIQSTSSRTTRTDPGGSFRFDQLGPGEHLLEVRAATFFTARERFDVERYGTEVEVRLEPSDP
jgi:protocatechuate 3,4-dioxygenase beta subunit